MMSHASTTRLYATTIAAVLAVLCMAGPASADVTLNTLGTWGGSVNALQVEGDLAYVAAGRRLVILNISDLTNPVEIGSIDLENVVFDVAVRDAYAYACTRWEPNYFCVVDVSNPTAPELVWTSGNWADGHLIDEAVGVELWGSVAYMRRDRAEIEVWDISQPGDPVFRNEMSLVVCDITIVDNLMYVLDDYQHVRIYDLSGDPFDPVQLGVVTLPATEDSGVAIAVEGNHAYALTRCCDSWDGAFAVVDVSNPYKPVVLGSSTDLYNAQDVAVSSGFAYVADWESGASPYGWERIGLKIFDVATDPSNPTLVNTYKTHGTVWGVEIFGTTAYVFDEGEGLILLDLSDPVNPVRLGNYYSPAELRKMAKIGDLLYVTDEWNGFTILDVSDPVRPTPVGVYQTPLDTPRYGHHMAHWGLEVRDGLAYLAAGYGQLQAVDVTDPVNPTLLGVGEFMSEYGSWCVGLGLWGDVASLGFAVPGDMAYFVNFDISYPENIVHIGDVLTDAPLTIDTTPEGIAFCAISSGYGTLLSIDTSDPNNPWVIGDYWPGGIDLARDGNVVYLANESSDEGIGGLYIVDVSDPADPLEQGRFPTRRGTAVALQDERAYFVGAYGGKTRLSVLDVSHPTTPLLLANAPLSNDRAGGVLADEPYVYVTGSFSAINGGNSGLMIFELEGLSPPGDLNGDGCVDQADLGILLADWGCAGGNCPGDCDHDGDTDHADLGILLAHWGEGCG